MDIGPVRIEKIKHHSIVFGVIQDDTIVFDNGGKRIQKLKRTILIADKSNSLNMNIWQNQFDLIERNASYQIKLLKVKVFNEDISVTTTAYTT